MKYKDFLQRNTFDKVEILAFSQGVLIEDPPGELAKLPSPPFLLIDRIIEISSDNRKGKIIAEKNISIDEWFFQFHFRNDPVMPGSFGLDAVWQLIGFFCCWKGSLGSGRALGVGTVEFEGQIRPYNQAVRYEIDIQRYSELKGQKTSIAIGDATVFVDGEPIYFIQKARVGVFENISYKDYPLKTQNHKGGILKR